MLEILFFSFVYPLMPTYSTLFIPRLIRTLDQITYNLTFRFHCYFFTSKDKKQSFIPHSIIFLQRNPMLRQSAICLSFTRNVNMIVFERVCFFTNMTALLPLLETFFILSLQFDTRPLIFSLRDSR